MSGPSENPLKRLVGELHRRHVWQVLVVYLGTSYAILEATDLFIDRIGLPEWVFTGVGVLLLFGLPVVLITAYLQEEDLQAVPEPGGHPGPTIAAERLFTWRNAITAAVVSFALWGLVATGWVLLGRPLAPGPSGIAVPRQLTFDGDVRQALGSPDGDFLAYEVVRDGLVRLFVAEGDGTSPVEIFRSDSFACCPAWSPDGTRLLYRDGPRRGGRGIVLPRLGGDPRSLPTDVVNAWSPDGERVVGWWPAADTLRLVDVAAGEKSGTIPLGLGHEWLMGVDWSPDGRTLAVATSHADSALGAVLWAVPLEGGPARELLRDSVAVWSPHWAASGEAIYVLRAEEDVWKIPVEDDGRTRAGEPTRLAARLSPNVWNGTLPAFSVSSDGRRLHYARWEGRANLARMDLAGGPEPALSEWEWLTSGTAPRSEPRVSPDGSRIAFLQEGPDGWNLWVRDGSGEVRRITFFDGFVASPAWSPDGTRLAFGGARGGKRGVWVADAEGTRVQGVGGERYGGFELVWLATGEILYQESGDRTYRILDPATGNERAVSAPDGAWLYAPRASPGGGRVAFRMTGNRSGLWVVGLTDGEWSRLSQRSMGAVGWSQDGDTVYAMPSESRSDESREVIAVPADGGVARTVALLPDGMAVNPWNATIDTDDGLLVAAIFSSSVDAWMLEGFDSSH